MLAPIHAQDFQMIGEEIRNSCVAVANQDRRCAEAIEAAINASARQPSRQAGRALEDVLAGVSQRVSSNTRSFADSLRGMATAKKYLGAPAEAEKYEAEALAQIREAAGLHAVELVPFLLDLAESLLSRGAIAKAEPLVTEVLRHADEVKDSERMRAWLQMAAVQRQQNQFPQAAENVERALGHARKLFGEESLAVARALLARVNLAIAQSRYDMAEADAKACQSLYEKLLEPDHSELAESLLASGSALYFRGQFVLAQPYFERSLAIRRARWGEEHPVTAFSIHQLSELHRAMGQYELAEQENLKALAIRKKILDANHPDLGWSLNSLGEIYRVQGRYREAEVQYLGALRIRKAAFGEVSQQYATALNNLGLLYATQGHPEQAEPMYIEALATFRKLLGNDHPSTGVSITTLASVYLSRSNFEKAAELYQEALNLREAKFGPKHPAVAAALNNLGLTYFFRGQLEKAEWLYSRAIETYKASLGPKHPSTAGAMGNLAMVYLRSGRLDQVEPLLRDGLEIARKALGESHPAATEFLVNLGILHARSGKWDEAAKYLDQAVSVQKKALGASHPDVANTLYLLASVSLKQERVSVAEPLLQEGLGIRKGFIGSNFLTLTEHGQREFLKLFAPERDLHLTSAIASGATPLLARLGAESNRMFKGLRLGAQQEVMARLKRHPDGRVEGAVNAVRDLTWRIAALDRRQGGKELSSQLKQQREGQEEALVRMVGYDKWTIEVGEREVWQALPADGCLVDIAYFRPRQSSDDWKSDNAPWRYAAFVYLPEEIHVVDLGPAESPDGIHPILNRLLGMDNSLWRNGKLVDASTILADLQARRPAMQLLHGRLFGRIRDRIGTGRFERIRHWIVCPDGEIGSMPLEMLRNPADGKFAAETLLISYAESPRALVQRNSYRPTRPGLAVLNPQYGANRARNAANAPPQISSGSSGMASLYQGKLSSRFRATFQNARILEGEDANETELLGWKSPESLLVWTHGEVMAKAEDPLDRPRFLLAGAGRESAAGGSQPGVVTARRMMSADLQGTELAVIAGCDTGFGTVEAGEGLQGMRRALWVAGAKSQLLTLWPVADRHTVRWLELFYEALAKPDTTILDAYSQTQRQFIEGRVAGLGPEQRHPYFWAPFTLSGEWARSGTKE